MKLRTVGLLSLTMAVCLSSALLAQEEGRGRGRGGPGGGGQGGPGGGRGPGGFGGGGMMGGGFSLGGALDLAGLLRMEEVQKEVGLTADAAQAVSEAIREVMPDMRELFSGSAEERAAKLKEPNAKAQEILDEVLAPDKQKRLMGLYAQQAGVRAVANELIAKEIGLDEAGIAKVKEVTTKAATSMSEKMREVRESGDFAKMREMMESSQKETEKAILDVLTDEQEKALEALKGEKFAFPERTFGRGGPGGGPGGPGAGGPGGRGGRSRPGSDN